MPLRPARRARRGVVGAPVARTAATVGAVAVAAHGVNRRQDRRDDRRDRPETAVPAAEPDRPNATPFGTTRGPTGPAVSPITEEGIMFASATPWLGLGLIGIIIWIAIAFWPAWSQDERATASSATSS